jgi:hypothetical protein
MPSDLYSYRQVSESPSKDECREEGRGSYRYWTGTKSTKTPNTTFPDKTVDTMESQLGAQYQGRNDQGVTGSNPMGCNKLTLDTSNMGSKAWRLTGLKRHSILLENKTQGAIHHAWAP